MTTEVSDALLERLRTVLAEQMGLHFPGRRIESLSRGVRAAVADLGFDSPDTCVRSLLASPLTEAQIKILADHLTIGETYFFRDPDAFDYLRDTVLPALIASRGRDRRSLRIWSAGSSSGEEAYSIAILLDKYFPQLRSWDVTILATDINPSSLRKAEEGIYTSWSFRMSPAWVSDEYFTPCGDKAVQLRADVRERVRFAYLNLVAGAYPSLATGTNAMDLIFCRNTLIYFGRDESHRVIERLHRCLVDGGWFVSSASEDFDPLRSLFVPVQYKNAFLYCKGGAREAVPPPPAAASPPSAPPPVVAEPVPSVESLDPWEIWDKDEKPIDDRPSAADRPETPAAPPSGLADADRLEQVRALYDAGEYQEVLAAFGVDQPLTGEQVDRISIQDNVLVVRAYANLGMLAEALASCERLLVAHKMEPSGHYLRATILQEMGQADEAAQSLQRAIYLDPDLVVAHFSLGNVRRTQGDAGRAARHFRAAADLLVAYDPQDELPESDGISAGQLSAAIESVRQLDA